MNLKIAYIYLWFRMHFEFDLVVMKQIFCSFAFFIRFHLFREYNPLGYSAKGNAPDSSKL